MRSGQDERTAHLTVPGQPVPLERMGRNGKRSYLPKESKEFRERVQTAWMCEGRPELGDGPLVLSVMFFFERKPSHLLKSGKLAKGAPVWVPRVDTSNCLKAIEDALNGLAYKDDSQIVVLSASKLYVNNGDEPRSEVEIRSLAV